MADQLEEKSEVKRLQLSSETAAIAFRAKQRECDSLLQLNQEVYTALAYFVYIPHHYNVCVPHSSPVRFVT